MYLSQLLVNPESRQAIRDLSDVHAMHQRVMSAFPDDVASSARKEHGVLFRVENTGIGKCAMLVQSLTSPNWSRLPNDYLAEPNAAVVKPIDPLLSTVSNGARYRFRIRANPTKRLRTHTDTPGKRIELRNPIDALRWFARHASASGFGPGLAEPDWGTDVDGLGSWDASVRILGQERALGRRGDARVMLGGTTFDGILTVSEVEPFLNAVRKGIGSGKAYGFGLLSIAPL